MDNEKTVEEIVISVTKGRCLMENNLAVSTIKKIILSRADGDILRESQFDYVAELITQKLDTYYRKKFEVDKKYNANFLWGKGELEEIGYEFANAKTEEYQKECWEELLSAIRKKFVGMFNAEDIKKYLFSTTFTSLGLAILMNL